MKCKIKNNKLFLATGNKGKIIEITQMLKKYEIELLSTNDISIVEPEETGSTFAENAILKAKYYCKKTGYTSLADDSGLSIKSLNGDPGVFSARWAKNGKDFPYAMNKIKDLLDNNKPTDAFFICCLALFNPDGTYHIFEGRVDGNISFPPRGSNGFGYDPIFIPKGYDMTFAEIPYLEKDKISHRRLAFNKLEKFIF